MPACSVSAVRDLPAKFTVATTFKKNTTVMNPALGKSEPCYSPNVKLGLKQRQAQADLQQ